jgi:AAA domain
MSRWAGSIAGTKSPRARWCICAFEGAEGHGKRAEAFRQRYLPEDAEAEVEVEPVPFYLVAAQMNLVKDHASLIEEIRLQLGDTIPVGVVLDTLNRSLHGSESEDKDMGAYVQAATAIREAFNCAVIIVHHCGVSGDRPRGHTSLTGAADAQIAVRRDSAGYVIATVEWMKDGPEGTTIASKLVQVEVGVDEDGDAITSCVVVPVEDRPVEAARKETKSGRVFHDAFIEALDAKGQTIRVRGDGPSVKAVNVEDIRPEFNARYVTAEADPKKRTDAQRKAFKRALSASGLPTWANGSVEWMWQTSGGP